MTQTSGNPGPPKDGASQGLNELGEDTTGFGQLELRTLKDSLLRPAVVLEAYMTRGPTGGSQYARPLRLYLTLCGVLMLQLFLMGGTTIMFAGLPPRRWTRSSPSPARAGTPSSPTRTTGCRSFWCR